MKILFDHPNPFLLAHGGFQTQIEQTKLALEQAGVEVEYLRWWDDHQKGEIIHFFGRPDQAYIRFAHEKGIKVVMSALHGGLGARPAAGRYLQRAVMKCAKRLVPKSFTERLAWDSYRLADACIVLTKWEEHLVKEMFGAPEERLHVLPNGVEDIFFKGACSSRGKWLVTTASILPVKRILETAQAALKAATPYWVIGKPFSLTDPYFTAFKDLQSSHPDLLRYEGPISERATLAEIYQQARGFVLLSKWETLSISALEAAASGCPLLLSQLPWATWTFGKHARYCSPSEGTDQTAQILRSFYEEAPLAPCPPKPSSWGEVALQLKSLYQGLLSR